MFAGLAGVCFVGVVSSSCGSNGGGSDAGLDHSSPQVPGLEAATAKIGFPAMCESCIAANCAAQFEACWPDPACQKTEICTGRCVEKQGKSPYVCAYEVCAPDSGASEGGADGGFPDGGFTDGAIPDSGINVTNLNQCIVGLCSTECAPS